MPLESMSEGGGPPNSSRSPNEGGEEGPEENGKRKQRRYRTTFTACQLDDLEQVSRILYNMDTKNFPHFLDRFSSLQIFGATHYPDCSLRLVARFTFYGVRAIVLFQNS